MKRAGCERPDYHICPDQLLKDCRYSFHDEDTADDRTLGVGAREGVWSVALISLSEQ